MRHHDGRREGHRDVLLGDGGTGHPDLVLRGRSMSTYGYSRSKPPLVTQPIEYDEDGIRSVSNSCWAAALSSWLGASGRSQYSVENLQQIFAAYSSSLGLKLGYFDEVASSILVNMDWEQLGQADLTFEYLYLKLQVSHLYLMKIKSPAHVVVLYGVTRDAESGTGEEIRIMDPFYGKYKAGPLSVWRKEAKSYIVGWAKS